MIRITYEFETEAEAQAFLNRDQAQVTLTNFEIPVNAPLVKRHRRTNAEIAAANAAKNAAVPMSSPAEGDKPQPSGQQAESSVAAAPTPVKAAPKAPNAPVKAIAEAPAPVAPKTSAPPPPPAPAATLDAARAALREVFNTKGAKVATDILTTFKATRISDVKPADYAAFIKACA